MNIQVECNDERFFHKLLSVGARVVINLPTKIDLKKFSTHKKLLVGKISTTYEGSVDEVYDLIIKDADLDGVKNYHKKGKRVLVYAKDYKEEIGKFVFAVIE